LTIDDRLEPHSNAPAWGSPITLGEYVQKRDRKHYGNPDRATRVRLKIAPQRGQVRALAEIIAPRARHEVILVVMLPRCLAPAHFRFRSATSALRDRVAGRLG